MRKLKQCGRCKQRKTQSHFYKSQNSRDGLQNRCKICVNQATKLYIRKHREELREKRKKYASNRPEWVLWTEAKRRAHREDLPFTIIVSDVTIPSYCPALGIPLRKVGGRITANSPSIDRFLPSLGYTSGNIRVISYLANRIKTNATADQVLAVGHWMKEQENKS